LGNVTITSDNKLIIAECSNSRVTIFNNIPTQNFASANVVVGQNDFAGELANQGGSAGANTLSCPHGTATDGQRLIVADRANRRVLIYNSIPASNGVSANVVVGQPDMATTSLGTTASKTDLIDAVFYDTFSGKLFVLDRGNSRVLIYNQIPTTNGASADVVVGQPDMTTGSAGTTSSKMSLGRSVHIANGSVNQGGVPAANTLNAPQGVYSDGTRLYITDTDNHRLLIYNSIPTSNNASADIVIGQPNFASNLVNQGTTDTPGANTLRQPFGVNATNNKLFVTDQFNHRILIFDNAIREPLISLGSIESAPEGKLRMRGNVRLGEWGRYSLNNSNMEVSVNGAGMADVSSLYGNRQDALDNLYEFFHEFEPGEGGYTLLFHAFSSNADEDHAFYFSPFELKSITSGNLPTFTFSVNSKYWSNISSNLDSYEVEVKKDGETAWTTYLTDIPVSSNQTNSSYLTTFDQNTGVITTRSNSKTLSGGKYQARMVALDKWGHKQYSPSLEFTSSGLPSFKPNLTIYNGWFRLQVNRISGVTSNILSSFNPGGIKTTYTSSTSNPTFSGIAYTDSTVTLLVTNKNNTSQQKTYTAKATDSLWKLTPTLYSNSIIDLWVQLGDKYNELPAFQINLNP